MRPDYKIEKYNIHLYSSCFTKKKEFDDLIQELYEDYPENEVLKNRTKKDLKYQWAYQNYLYMKGIIKDRGIDFKILNKFKRLFYLFLGKIIWSCIK